MTETGYARITDRADRADIDIGHMIRRMLTYADRHMPEGWLPGTKPEGHP